MTQKMFLDILGVLTTSKFSILNTFQGGGSWSPSRVVGLRNDYWLVMITTKYKPINFWCQLFIQDIFKIQEYPTFPSQ